MKIGLIAISSSISKEDYPKYSFQTLYDMVGLNTGNLVFTRAVERQLDAETIRLGYSFNNQTIKEKKIDKLVIPAANWLASKFDFGFLADTLEQTDVPVIVIGLGAQSEAYDSIPELQPGTLRFLKLISNRSEAISIRGHFTARVLDHYDVHNYIVTGCPSLYGDMLAKPKPLQNRESRSSQAVFQSTRFKATQAFAEISSAYDVNKFMFEQAYAQKADIIFQSEYEEMQLLYDSDDSFMDKHKQQILAKIYGAASYKDIKRYIFNHGKFYTNVDIWQKDVQKYSFSIGTRLHGTIQALLSGVPAVLAPHDTRTSEIAEFASIPTILPKNLIPVRDISLENIESQVDFETFHSNYNFIFDKYLEFLRENDLPYPRT